MARYRALSHDALIAELASHNDGVLSTSITGGLIVGTLRVARKGSVS